MLIKQYYIFLRLSCTKLMMFIAQNYLYITSHIITSQETWWWVTWAVAILRSCHMILQPCHRCTDVGCWKQPKYTDHPPTTVLRGRCVQYKQWRNWILFVMFTKHQLWIIQERRGGQLSQYRERWGEVGEEVNQNAGREIVPRYQRL